MISEPDRRQVDQTVELLRHALGLDLVAAYLYGSAALGGLHRFSDLDLMAVSARPTTLDQKRALGDALLEISGRRPGRESRSIELTIVVAADVRPWRYPPTMDFLYGDWLRADFEAGRIAPPRPNPDLAALVSMVRLTGVPLVGPDPGEVFDEVPRKDLNAGLVDEVDGLLEDLRSDTTNVLLTLARIWLTLATGEFRSKDAAADWAIARVADEDRGVLERARDIYLGDEDLPWDRLAIAAQGCADRLVARIRQEAGRD